jgi:CheY-like chemotaxis protein
MRLRFEVQDTGIGMTPQQVSRLFQPFEQVADEHWREGGAGLGLAISRQLVRAMGGDIEVHSTPDVGSVFSFELDMVVGATAGSAARAPIVRGYRGPRRTLLIADDSLRNRAMLIELLRTLGFAIAAAENGRDAVTQAERLKPDLILMDLMMPVMDGLEAMRRIRRLPQLEQVPIIAVSASASAEDADRSRAAGATAFLAKPVEHNALLKMIGEQLGLSWLSDQADDEPRATSRADAGELVIPPPEEMQVLHRLALIGDMREIRERADYLKQLDPRHARFANELSGLAQRYQSQALLALIEQYVTPNEERASGTDAHQR